MKAIDPIKAAKKMKVAGMKKIKSTSSTYDFNRPKRQVITRYSK